MSDEFDPLGEIAVFEQELGLHPGFFVDLLVKDDDWSFVIKLHALVEAAVSHLLTQTCGDERLLGTFSRLELSNPTTGKLAFAEALGALDSIDRKFIRKLSEIRNAFAHNVRNAGLTLEAYVKDLDDNQFKSFSDALRAPGDPFVVNSTTTVPARQFTRENPKLSIWLRGLIAIGFALSNKRLARQRREFTASALDLVKKISQGS